MIVFDVELDCGKAWRGRSLGAGVYQPEDPWEVRERLLEIKRRSRQKATFGTERAALKTKWNSIGDRRGEGDRWEQVSTSQKIRGR